MTTEHWLILSLLINAGLAFYAFIWQRGLIEQRDGYIKRIERETTHLTSHTTGE